MLVLSDPIVPRVHVRHSHCTRTELARRHIASGEAGGDWLEVRGVRWLGGPVKPELSLYLVDLDLEPLVVVVLNRQLQVLPLLPYRKQIARATGPPGTVREGRVRFVL